MNNLRYAFRQLRKSPGFTIIAVLTLALGIGANSAIFSVVNAVLLRPLPYPHPERLVYLNEVVGGTNTSIALPDYLDWRKDSKSFEHLAMSRLESRNLSGIAGREPERISVAYVTANFFNVIGLPPQIGRTFSEDEDKPGAPSLAVISDRLWDRAFHRDPQIVGRPMNFHDTPIIVIGVMPREMDSPHGADAWFAVMRRANLPGWQNRANHAMFFGGRPAVRRDRVRLARHGVHLRACHAHHDSVWSLARVAGGADRYQRRAPSRLVWKFGNENRAPESRLARDRRSGVDGVAPERGGP